MQKRRKHWSKWEIGDEYWPDDFLVSLSWDTPFLSEQDSNIRVDECYLAIFAHEYMHYFHNVSTVSGFKSILLTQKLVTAFTQTLMVNKDGTSVGSTALDEASTAVEFVGRERTFLDGQLGPAGTCTETDDDFDVEILSSNVEVEEREVDFGEGQPTKWPKVTATVEYTVNGRVASEQFVVGSVVIEESVVFALERLIAQQLQIPLFECPTFPYKYLDHLVEQELKINSLAVVAALGTLALLSPHPGAELAELFESYKTKAAFQSKLEPLEVIDLLVEERSEQFEKAVEVIRADLKDLVTIREGREFTKGALCFLQETVSRNLEARLEDPIFDVRRLASGLTKQNLSNFHIENPCDLLQARSGDERTFMRDLLTSFFPNGNKVTTYLRTLQAQQVYVKAHVERGWDAFKTSEQAEAPCPYLTCCHLNKRRDSFDTCSTKPWEHFERNGQNCWYGVGVAETLGESSLRSHTEE